MDPLALAEAAGHRDPEGVAQLIGTPSGLPRHVARPSRRACTWQTSGPVIGETGRLLARAAAEPSPGGQAADNGRANYV
jgi:hypothetical protein